MNFRKQKEFYKAILFASFVFFSFCCVTKKEMKIYEISHVIPLKGNKDFSFSKESEISIGHDSYSLRSRLIYDDEGGAINLLVYKPEGILTYTNEELAKDTSLLVSLGFPFNQAWSYQDGTIRIPNEGNIPAEEIEKGILKAFYNENVLIIKVK